MFVAAVASARKSAACLSEAGSCGVTAVIETDGDRWTDDVPGVHRSQSWVLMVVVVVVVMAAGRKV